MLLIYNDPTAMERLSQDEQDKLMADVGGLMEELNANRELVGGDALADASQTRTVRVVGGSVATTDGPFVEVKEHLAGYIMVDVPSLERAVEIASRWPDARFGAMEVRPVIDTIATDKLVDVEAAAGI
ncbi:YciI family protein [Micromonospora sp. NPDC006766]|uniref:YciI family protein n=1 Tax=Micromonospora sp. NPDC006766 TaxID=3154778 RepID=UPI0033D82B27